LERPILVIPPDGSDTANNVSTAYAGNVTTVTDQAGAARKNQTEQSSETDAGKSPTFAPAMAA